MSRHVRRVRSKLDAALRCANKEELLTTLDENSVHVQLRSPVYPAIGFIKKKGKLLLFSTSDAVVCLLTVLQANTARELEWNQTSSHDNHKGGPQFF